jgi:hypothetical protein
MRGDTSGEKQGTWVDQVSWETFKACSTREESESWRRGARVCKGMGTCITLKDWSIPVYSSASNDLTPGGNVHHAKRPGAISCGAVRKSHCDARSGEIISA